MIVTIDGPAGAGKSHVARLLAKQLGFHFLDTGAMYRAVALAALRKGLDRNDCQGLANFTSGIRIELQGDRVLLDGEDVTNEIRTTSVTSATRYVADNANVRQQLVQLQRHFAAERDTITEGRDQGTLAFPNAECKIYLTASSNERARRRWRELQARGETISFDDLLAQQNERDQRDASRPVGRLYRADDAVEICTDGLTPEQVVDRVAAIVRERRTQLGI